MFACGFVLINQGLVALIINLNLGEKLNFFFSMGALGCAFFLPLLGLMFQFLNQEQNPVFEEDPYAPVFPNVPIADRWQRAEKPLVKGKKMPKKKKLASRWVGMIEEIVQLPRWTEWERMYVRSMLYREHPHKIYAMHKKLCLIT